MLRPSGLLALYLVARAGSRVPLRIVEDAGTVLTGRMKPSSGTRSGGSTCFCAARIVTSDILFSILMSARAVMLGLRPYPISKELFRNLGAM